MNDLTRRDALKLAGAVGMTAVTGGSVSAAKEAADRQYTQARVEWWDESRGDAVAFRVSDQVSHFCEFTNPKGLAIAVAAGMNGLRVDFTTSGEEGGHWRRVIITKVHKINK